MKKTENRFARETLVLIPLARTDHVKRSYIPKLLESRDAMIEEMEKKKKKKERKRSQHRNSQAYIEFNVISG